MSDSTIGIDVSKAHLDACRWPGDETRRFANDAKGHRALLAWIGSDVGLVVFEPTGRYHRPLERAVHRAGLPFARLHPTRARRFAEATGILAKTDRVDAAMLAPAPPGHPRRARRRTRRRRDRRRHGRPDRRRSRPRQKGRHPRQHPRGRPGHAAAILAEMPEIGTLEPGQAGSLSGTAPITRESGRWKGQARIRGGRAGLRRAVYMPALSAVRCNPDLKATYDRLRANGKPFKLALTAIMRKLLILANALIRDNRTWTPAKPA